MQKEMKIDKKYRYKNLYFDKKFAENVPKF